MDEHSCRSGAEWEALLDVVMMMKNRLMLKNGFSPVQRVLGYAPRLPGGFLTGDPGNHAMPSQVRLGSDLGLEKSMSMRRAAAKAFMEAACEDALRRAISSGPRQFTDFDIGELVYFYRQGMNKQLKHAAGFWEGPGRVVMLDPPSTIWVNYLRQAGQVCTREASSSQPMKNT